MSNNKSSGVSFSSLLTIVFIVLKLTDVIDWSWVWVLSPSWISLLLGLALIPVILMLNKKIENDKPINKFFEDRLKKMVKGQK